MRIVAGLSLSNLHPHVWDPNSPFYIVDLDAVMVSYADLHSRPRLRKRAMEVGMHDSLGIPRTVSIFLDNGAFYFRRRDLEVQFQDYEELVTAAKPDWYPIPRDYIPMPGMTEAEKTLCVDRTMRVNEMYQSDGYVPVIHIGDRLETYVQAVVANQLLVRKERIALGGIVPNLLRTPRAMHYHDILSGLRHMRDSFSDKSLHVFGIGGTATVHLAALLGIDSVDSAGWRNRAARGIIQLPGSGERMVAELGSWRGRVLSAQEEKSLAQCGCSACTRSGVVGLRLHGIEGFRNRATHNLWVLLEEAKLVQNHLDSGTYQDWFQTHLVNSTYVPLIRELAMAV